MAGDEAVAAALRGGETAGPGSHSLHDQSEQNADFEKPETSTCSCVCVERIKSTSTNKNQPRTE